jgi:cobalt-precorrin-5B (C1)-methyltransferase
VEIALPNGGNFTPEIRPHRDGRCGVLKDAGDDPDVTNGSEICARVCVSDSNGAIAFRAGEGVGVITRPGLKLPVGEAAINPVPRAMIERAVRSVFGDRAAEVTISIPGGEALARGTFNPRLGVEGGLSVLGTTGVVRPMSEDALTESIALSLSVLRAQGADRIGAVFGNQGEAALGALYPGLGVVTMSNFVGFTLDEAVRQGFSALMIAGHPGKLAKVAAGVMQTHSRTADARREALVAHLALMGTAEDLLARVFDCRTTDATVSLIHEARMDGVWPRLADAAQHYCEARTRGAIAVDALFLSGDARVLGASKRLREDENRWRKA